MNEKYFIVEMWDDDECGVYMDKDGHTIWFESRLDANATGNDLIGVLNSDYIICQKP